MYTLYRLVCVCVYIYMVYMVEGKQYRWKCVLIPEPSPISLVLLVPDVPQNRRTLQNNRHRSDNNGQAPLLIGHLYHLKVTIGRNLIYAKNAGRPTEMKGFRIRIARRAVWICRDEFDVYSL